MTSCSTLACSGVTSTAWVSAIVARTAIAQPMTSTTIATSAPTRIPTGTDRETRIPIAAPRMPDEQEFRRRA